MSGEVAYTVLPTGFDASGVLAVAWRGLRVGDVGRPLKCGPGQRTLQVAGVFGVLGQVTIEGSLDPEHTVWATMNDPQGNELAFSVAKLETVQEGCLWLRPCVSRGDAVTCLDIYVLAH
jgi:hypothetical protein